MLCSKLYFAFLTVALSSYTVQAAPQFLNNKKDNCPPPTTVTVTARGAGATGVTGNLTLVGNSTTTASAASATATDAKGAKGNNTSNDPQKSLTLDRRVIAKGFENNGQNVPAAGQVPSLTSSNDFINFCLTVPNLPLTDGKQVATGSCNPAPMGIIPNARNMPSAKFVFPPNFATVKEKTPFTIKLAIKGMETGFFVNAKENYFAAPQQLNRQGQIQGHSHVVIETLSSLTQTTPTDPTKFAFFKGLNNAAVGGILSVDVTNGLPVGTYKISTINTAANHQPVLVPVAQHGSLDDVAYFSVTASGIAASNSTTTAGSATGGAASNSTVSATGAATNGAGAGKGAQSTVIASSTPAPPAGGKGQAGVTSSSSAPAATPTGTGAAGSTKGKTN